MMPTQEKSSGSRTAEFAPVRLTILRTILVMAIAGVLAALLHLFIGRYYNTVWYDVTVALIASAIISPVFLYPSYLTAHQLRRANAFILKQASSDHLTGLPNYFALSEEIEARLAQTDSEKGLAVHFIDVNAFKHVNNSLGHDFGNELLIEVALALRRAVAGRAFLARFAGDEFVIVQPISGSITEAKELVAQVRQEVARDYELRRHRVHVDITVGSAISPFHANAVVDS